MKTKCPFCDHEFDVKTAMTAAEMGRKSKRKDGGGARCRRHGIFLKNGVCSQCEKFKGLGK